MSIIFHTARGNTGSSSHSTAFTEYSLLERKHIVCHTCLLRMAHAGAWLRPPAVAGRQLAAEPCSRQSSSLGTSTTGRPRLHGHCNATREGPAGSLRFADAAEETRVAKRVAQHDYTYPARLLSKKQVPCLSLPGSLAHLLWCACGLTATGCRSWMRWRRAVIQTAAHTSPSIPPSSRAL